MDVLVIINVSPDSQAATFGLQKSDIIVSHDSKQIHTNEDLDDSVESARSENKSTMPLVIKRGESELTYECTTEPLGIYSHFI